MKIPFIDLGVQHKEIAGHIDSAIKNVIIRGDFILGEDVKLFEQEFADYCGVRFAVGVSSGTAALFLALKSLGIGENDEVMIPDFTFIATAFVVSYVGAKPVFVDIEEDTYNIDPRKIRGAITKNTKAIIPVHLFGQPANMPEILKIARDHNLKVIEDACQAHGAEMEMPDRSWRKTGSLADMGCFSFYPTKNLGGFGDGGMITTGSEEVYRLLLKLRDCGRVSKYEHDIIGFNSRLDTLQAAVLRVKLKKLDKWNKMRQEAAGFYNKLFKGQEVTAPSVTGFARHVYHAYAVRIKNRDSVLEKLKENGVGAAIYYPIPLHLQKAYAHLDLGRKAGDFPVSEKVAQDIIALPLYPHIKKSQIEFVVKIISDLAAK